MQALQEHTEQASVPLTKALLFLVSKLHKVQAGWLHAAAGRQEPLRQQQGRLLPEYLSTTRESLLGKKGALAGA